MTDIATLLAQRAQERPQTIEVPLPNLIDPETNEPKKITLRVPDITELSDIIFKAECEAPYRVPVEFAQRIGLLRPPLVVNAAIVAACILNDGGRSDVAAADIVDTPLRKGEVQRACNPENPYSITSDLKVTGLVFPDDEINLMGQEVRKAAGMERPRTPDEILHDAILEKMVKPVLEQYLQAVIATSATKEDVPKLEDVLRAIGKVFQKEEIQRIAEAIMNAARITDTSEPLTSPDDQIFQTVKN
ncbi:MAG: hypothetical protein MJ014_00115 [Methanocorpusculum sp.]|nr:hypothetical protein [Methanocorpusculum sp.]